MTTTTDIRTPEGTSQVEMTREFAAPVALVWRCYTEPDLLARWLGPARLACRIDHDEQRHGGHYAFTNIDEDGTEYGFRGVYHGDPSPELTIRTFEWLGAPGHVSLETMRMVDLGGGRTRVDVTSVFQSVQDRDGMATAMQSGVDEGFEKLDALLAGMA